MDIMDSDGVGISSSQMKIIGNILPLLKSFYDRFLEDGVELPGVPATRKKFKEIDFYLEELIKRNFAFKRIKMSGWFTMQKFPMPWHRDRWDAGDTHVVIAAYPCPTQFIVDNNIFTPDVGDLALTPIEAKHRANPESVGLPHLIARAWLA